jgi:hypothetical protein
MFLGILMVNADTCSLVKDTQVSNNRILTCDATSQTTTRFTYPKNNDVEVFKNDLCTITCKEDILFAVDPAKDVRAGMGFNYPLYMSAERTCTAVYDFESFDTNLRTLVSQRDLYAKGSAEYRNKSNEISNQLQIKKECDTWGDIEEETPIGKYEMDPTISLKIETSESEINMPYVFKGFVTKDGEVEETEKEEEYYNRVFETEIDPYSSCDLKDIATSSCTENKETISGWTEIARIDGKYTMKETFVELYTGKITSTEVETGIGKTCRAKDAYFTSFYELTRPLPDDIADKGYALTLSATDLGNNIKSTGDAWTLNVNCWYTVENLLFPTEDDVSYVKYGSTAFMYRTIDLIDPFPNREPGENWNGKVSLITDTSDTVRDKIIYEINLNTGSIKKIRQFNSNQSYVTFNLDDMERSRFIEDNIGIIDRK